MERPEVKVSARSGSGSGNSAPPEAERLSFSRRHLLSIGTGTLVTLTTMGGVAAGEEATERSAGHMLPDLDYLEHLGLPGLLPGTMPYLPPSALHPAYSHAIYVNTAPQGVASQKMWVIARSGSGWVLALEDAEHWQDQPALYSWPVSTGMQAPGKPPYVLTPVGIFNIDERSQRFRPGWGSPGMYNSVYIDLHYHSGRISSVALHGTTRSMYALLGQRASHGCVRMSQANADLLWNMIHPEGAAGADSPLWGEVPRFFRSPPQDNLMARTGYVRDGSPLIDEDGSPLTKMGYRVICVFFRDDGGDA